jgi:hypothetical protein
VGIACDIYGKKGNVYWILVGKPKGNRPLGRPRQKWGIILKSILKEIGWEVMDLIDLAKDRDK